MSKNKPAAVYMNIDDLYPAPDNPRVNDHVVDKVVRSIQLHGFASPIVANLEGEILAGHTRWQAAKKLNMLSVPVRQMNLSGDQARLYRIADNKLSEFADWDEDMLREQLVDLEKAFPVDVADLFTDDELEELILNKNILTFDEEEEGGFADSTQNQDKEKIIISIFIPYNKDTNIVKEKTFKIINEYGLNYDVQEK